MAGNNATASGSKSASLTKKLKPRKKATASRSVGRFLTPFKTACLAFSLLISSHVIWAMVFGTDLGGQPQAILDINWVRPADNQPFTSDIESDNQFMNNGYSAVDQQDFAANSQMEMPRITASGNAKIIHLSNEMSEAGPDNFYTTGQLVRAPIEEVVQFSKYGKLPKIGVLGKKPADVYARPAPKFDGRPRIAIMITGLGIHHQATKKAIDGLPGEVSFAFSPYGEGLQDWINRARDKGHEIILQAPMEPFDYPDNDPGPSTLLTDGDLQVNMSRFRWVMSRITGYIGITNFMGAKFTSKEKAISPILKEIRDRGLYYIENGILHRSKVSQISKDMGLGFAKVDVIIDDKKNIEYIENSLERIEKIAATTGMAFAIGSNLPATIEHVRAWVKSLEGKGYQLIPMSVKVKNELKTNVTTASAQPKQ